MKRLPLLLLSFLLFPFTSIAHGPTPQKGMESITINAPVEAVWDVIKPLMPLPDGILMSKPVPVTANASDGSGTITLQNDDQLVESLDYYTYRS